MQQQSLQSVRKRARKACESCRKRKRRCDGSQPCRACIEYEYDCHYADQPPTSATVGESVPSITVLAQPTGILREKQFDSGHGPSARGSLAAFPQAVARTVYGRSVPVSHSFGYSIGMPTSTDPQNLAPERLASVMSLDIAEKYYQRYCDSCGLLFPIIDNEVLLEELQQSFASSQSQQPASSKEVAISFAVLLGSYFSWPMLADKHDTLLLYAQQELDRLTFRQRSTEARWLLQAWILKTLLLRMTSSPDLVWLSSCNMMHVAELTGGLLQQQDPGLPDVAGSIAVEESSAAFNVAWTLNQLISLESGRSTAVSVEPVLRGEERSKETGEIFKLQKIFQRMQELEAHKSPMAARTYLLELCHRRAASSSALDIRALLIEACIICGIYRQLFKRGECLDAEVVSVMKPIFQSALTAAEELLETGEPWFMLAEFPSQLACICLALGRPLIDLLPLVSTLLDKTMRSFGTNALKETQETISLLFEACLKSRDEDRSALQKSLRDLSSSGKMPTSTEEEVWTQFLNQQVFE